MILTSALRGLGDAGISPLFFSAVLLSAWYGGLGPGLLATFFSSSATAYLILTEHGAPFATISDHLPRLIVFGVVSVLTSSVQSALRDAAESSRMAKEAAEASNEAKTRFMAMVSHELRTPLNPVLLITRLMERDSSLTPAMQDDIRTIRRNVDLEVRLIDDLMDLTRINAGKMNLHMAVMNLYDAVKAAIEVCQDDVQEKQLNLVTEFAATAPHVRGDSVRLQQVFWNLLRNAVKFTPQNGVITIRVENGMFGSVTVRVCDNGIGIDSKRLTSIFQAFEQGEVDIHARFGGLGLGLTICQAIVEAHLGAISAASDGKGRGAVFSVTLPITVEPNHRNGYCDKSVQSVSKNIPERSSSEI
jgi:signal transduction histidine kinase